MEQAQAQHAAPPSASFAATPLASVATGAASAATMPSASAVAHHTPVSSIQLQIFGTFDGTAGEQAIQWLADVQILGVPHAPTQGTGGYAHTLQTER